MLVRVLGAAAVLLAVLGLRGGPWVRDRRDLRTLWVLGLLGIAANQGLFVAGLARTTAINATILVTTVPVLTVLGSVLTGREPASALKLAGIGLAAAGTVYLIGPDRITLAPEAALGNTRYDSLTVSTHVMTFAIAAVLPVGVVALHDVDPAAIDPGIWGWVAYIVAFPTSLAYLLNIWALRRVSHNVVAVYIYLQPLMTALVAPLVLAGEELTARAAAAGIAIFSGVGMVLWAEHRQRREVPVEALGE